MAAFWEMCTNIHQQQPYPGSGTQQLHKKPSSICVYRKHQKNLNNVLAISIQHLNTKATTE